MVAWVESTLTLQEEEGGEVVACITIDGSQSPMMCVSSADRWDVGQEIAPKGGQTTLREPSQLIDGAKGEEGMGREKMICLTAEEQRKGSETQTHSRSCNEEQLTVLTTPRHVHSTHIPEGAQSYDSYVKNSSDAFKKMPQFELAVNGHKLKFMVDLGAGHSVV